MGSGMCSVRYRPLRAHRPLRADLPQSLSGQGFPVRAYDVYPPSLAVAVKSGSTPAETPREAAKGVRVLALMVVNAIQVEDVLFGAGGVADGVSLPT